METLERNSDCIDRLMSLVSDLKMTMDRKQPQYKPKIYQGRSHETKTQVNKMLHLDIDPLVEEEIKVVIEEITTVGIIIDQNYGNRSRGRWNNHRSGDRSGNYPNYNR